MPLELGKPQKSHAHFAQRLARSVSTAYSEASSDSEELTYVMDPREGAEVGKGRRQTRRVLRIRTEDLAHPWKPGDPKAIQPNKRETTNLGLWTDHEPGLRILAMNIQRHTAACP